MQMHPILIGTDLREPSWEAIRQGNAWAKERGAPLVLCHVMPRHVGTGMLVGELPEAALEKSAFEDRVAERLQELAAQLTERPPEELEVVIDEGAPGTELLREADRRDAGLIVVSEPLGEATRPVLVARAHPPTRRILVATDFSPASHAALALAAEEAKLRGAELNVLTSIEPYLQTVLFVAQLGTDVQFVDGEVHDERKKAEARVAAELKALGAPGKILVTDVNLAAGLIDAATRLDAELIVIGAERMAARVTKQAPCSVLVVTSSSPAQP
jgi:nucleotide-binding universal stress UspA family protein